MNLASIEGITKSRGGGGRKTEQKEITFIPNSLKLLSWVCGRRGETQRILPLPAGKKTRAPIVFAATARDSSGVGGRVWWGDPHFWVY